MPDEEDRRQEEKGMTEDEMVGGHQQLNGHELEQAPGVDEGQGSLTCCSPQGHKESDMTEQQNNSNLKESSSSPCLGFPPRNMVCLSDTLFLMLKKSHKVDKFILILQEKKLMRLKQLSACLKSCLKYI